MLRPVYTLLLGVLAAPAIFSAALHGQTVHAFVTTSDLTSTLKAQPAMQFGARQSLPTIITVDAAHRYQTMDGFGASITDGSAWLLHDKLTPAVREEAMHRLFDRKDGIGLSFLRQPIASSDLSRDHYSFDDMPPGQTDPKLAHFSTAHDNAYVFPILREALQLNPNITVMATPWSPPGWMKNNPSKTGTEESMYGGKLSTDAMAVYAEYLVRSVQAFKAAGVLVQYLSVQNEPLFETKNYPGTLMLADQQAQLIGKYLGPDLKRAGLKTEVLAYDHNWNHPEYPLALLADAAAAPYVAGSALHCYGGDVSAQTAIHDRYPDKGVWMTECSGGTWQKENALITTAQLLIGSTRNWAKAVSLWGIALDTEHNPHAGGCGTCRPLVEVNLHQQPATVSYTGDFYALGHATRFVHPGATRIDSNSPGPGSLETVAFENRDHEIALLVLNDQKTAADFTVRWHGRDVQATLPAGALATYTWQAE